MYYLSDFFWQKIHNLGNFFVVSNKLAHVHVDLNGNVEIIRSGTNNKISLNGINLVY